MVASGVASIPNPSGRARNSISRGERLLAAIACRGLDRYTLVAFNKVRQYFTDIDFLAQNGPPRSTFHRTPPSSSGGWNVQFNFRRAAPPLRFDFVRTFKKEEVRTGFMHKRAEKTRLARKPGTSPSPKKPDRFRFYQRVVLRVLSN